MKLVPVNFLRILILLAVFFSAVGAAAETYVIPFKAMIREEPQKIAKQWDDTYFVVMTQKDPDQMLFMVKPDKDSGIMTDISYFTPGVSYYSEEEEAGSYLLTLYTEELPDRFMTIEKEPRIIGNSSIEMVYSVNFVYHGEFEEWIATDSLYISKETYNQILDIVKKQIKEIGIPKIE